MTPANPVVSVILAYGIGGRAREAAGAVAPGRG